MYLSYSFFINRPSDIIITDMKSHSKSSYIIPNEFQQLSRNVTNSFHYRYSMYVSQDLKQIIMEMNSIGRIVCHKWELKGLEISFQIIYWMQ